MKKYKYTRLQLAKADKPKEECEHVYSILHNGIETETMACVKCGFHPIPLKTTPEIERLTWDSSISAMGSENQMLFCIWDKVNQIIDFLSTKEEGNK
jgi:hypothetical protein